MMDFLWRVWWLRSSPHPCSKPAQKNFGEGFGERVRTKATLESSISRLLLNPNLAKKGGAARRVSGNPIQQAIAAERKSPACEDAAGTGTEALGGGRVGQFCRQKRTRPSAQYTANGLASPGH
jgi:hypothetical protein